MPSICDLPDEILLGVLRGLEAIRSYETQSIAFKHKGAEKGRQRENKIRQQALYALCLTSQRLRCISLPTLYASSITCATRMGLGKLELFHKTISSPENAIRQSKPLAEHLKYVENRLADYLGNSLQDDEVFQEKSVSRYFHLLSRVVLCAPNVENLCVVSLEHNEVSFWEHLFAKSYPSKNLIGHGLNKLKYLSVQMHAQTWFHVPRVAVFERLSLTFQSFTMLSELRISGAATNRDSGVVFYLGELPSLQRLELTECTLEMYEVAHLLLACNNARHFTCKWAFLHGACSGPSELHAALLAHADTLESLTLDMRQVRYYPYISTDVKLLSSLRPLKTLRSLVISETGFFSSNLSILDFPDLILDPGVPELLPESLWHMTILIQGDNKPYDEKVLEDAFPLWQVVHDRKVEMPHLKTLCVKSRHGLTAPILATALQRIEVFFHTEIED